MTKTDEPSLFKTLRLQTVIYQSYLSSALAPILFIELLLLLLYFGINQYMSTAHKESLYTETVTSLEQIVDREVSNINLKLIGISQLTQLLRLDHQTFFSSDKSCEQPNGHAEYGVHKNGAYYKLRNNGGGSLYYAKSTVLGPQQKSKAKCTETLDPLLKNIVDTNSIVTQAYLNTQDNMVRIYPFIDDVPNQFGADVALKDYNFYFLADQQHNPDRKTVWTKAYLENDGLGWMVSAVTPIYHNNKLEGVTGIDVTITTIVDDLLNIKLPWDSSSFVIDSEGGILAMTKKIEQLLDIKELTSTKPNVKVKETTYKPKEYSILQSNNPEIKKLAHVILSNNGGTYKLTLNDENYILKVGVIPETGWRMLTLVNSSMVLQPMTTLGQLSTDIGYVAIIVILVFYVMFFIYLVKKSRILSRKISNPIEKLSTHTAKLAKNDDLILLETVGIDEIDQLTDNFNQLNIELGKRSDALVKGKVREQILSKEREFLEKSSQFDNLTGVFNRHKINEILEQETKGVKHYHHGVGVLIIDIDHFKHLNDTYGYKVGDNVLKRLAMLLKKGTNPANIFGRWAGDEFLLICADTDEVKLQNTAAKICSYITSCYFEEVHTITVSIGCSYHWQSSSSAIAVIKNAQAALADAKNKGVNQSVFYSESEQSA